MIVALPIHNSTPNIANLAGDLKRKGLLPEHVLRVICVREDEALAYQIGDELKDCFLKVTTEALPGKFRTPNHLANRMLVTAMDFFKSYTPEAVHPAEAPMLYFHTLYRPVRAGWLNEIQAEFFLKGAPPVMARTISPDVRTDRNQKVLNRRRLTVGPVVFGRKSIGNLPLIHFLDEKEHWRSRMAMELAVGMVETKQIGAGGKSLLREMQPAKIEA